MNRKLLGENDLRATLARTERNTGSAQRYFGTSSPDLNHERPSCPARNTTDTIRAILSLLAGRTAVDYRAPFPSPRL